MGEAVEEVEAVVVVVVAGIEVEVVDEAVGGIEIEGGMTMLGCLRLYKARRKRGLDRGEAAA